MKKVLWVLQNIKGTLDFYDELNLMMLVASVCSWRNHHHSYNELHVDSLTRDMLDQLNVLHLWDNVVTENTLSFIKSHENQLRKYHWPINNMLASPNFGFYYSRRPGTGKELLTLAKDNDVTNCVEEHAMFLWANCSLDEYLEKYEPLVVKGADDSTWMERQYFEDQSQDVVYKINKYITSKIDKKIYFRHI